MYKSTILILFTCCLFLFNACDKEDDSDNNNNSNINNNTNTNNTNNNNNNNTLNIAGCYDGQVDCNSSVADASAEIQDSTSTIFLVDLAYAESLIFSPDFYAILSTTTEFTIPQQPLRQSGTGALVHGQGVFRNDSVIIYTFLNSSSGLNDFPCNYFLPKISCGP